MNKFVNIKQAIIPHRRFKINIDIYGKKTCHYCTLAKELLASKALPFNYYDIEAEGFNIDHFKQKLLDNGYPLTVPAIYINGRFVMGGYTGLKEMFTEASEIAPDQQFLAG